MIEPLLRELAQRLNDGLLVSTGDELRHNPELDSWQVKQTISMVISLRRTSRHLCRATIEIDPLYVAWAARNLMELEVLVKFVTTSESNAERFERDAVIDVKNLCNSFSKWFENNKSPSPDNPEHLSAVDKVKAFNSELPRFGVGEKDSFLSVTDLAKTLDLPADFEFFYKLSSKHVHMTALSVLSPPTGEEGEKIWKMLFVTGASAALRSMGLLEARLKKLGFSL